MLASCPSLRCSYRKRPVSCREAQRLLTQLWSPRFVAIQWLCSQLRYETAANQWTISSSGLEVGLPAFQLPMFAKCDTLAKGCSTCLFKTSIPAVPFWNSKHPLRTRSLRFLRATVRSTSSAWWLHHAHPFVAASEKSTCLMQRSKAFGHAVVVSKICCNALISSPMWLLQTFSLCGLEAGLPAFQLPMVGKCEVLPKKDLFDLLVSGIYSRHSFSDFQASTPYTRSRFLTAIVRSTSSAWWWYHAHHFVAASEKSTCLMQRSKAFGHAVVVSKICCNTVIVPSVVLWDCCKLMKICRDWAFSNSGLEVGLPAFQLPMFAKCDALPKGDLLDMFV